MLGQVRTIPREDERLAEAVAAETVVNWPTLQHVIKLEVFQLGNRARSKTITAGLIPREHGTISEHDVAAKTSQMCCGRGSTGTSANNKDVRVHGLLRRSRHSDLSGRLQDSPIVSYPERCRSPRPSEGLGVRKDAE